MPSSLTQTVTVVALSDSEVIKRAWETNPDFDIIFYAIWCIMYVLTISPSVVGVVPILNFKQVIFWYLVYEAVLNYLNLDKHPASESEIWTTQNWLFFSLRRIGVEYGINFLYPFTQSIVGLNWVLNLIPLGLSYLNIFVL